MSVDTEQITRTYGHFIDGTAEPASDQVIVRHSPAHGRPVTSVSAGTEDDVRRAVEAARSAFDDRGWPSLTGVERGRILERWADGIEDAAEDLARFEVEEVGKPIRQARGDVEASVGLIRYAATLAPNVHGEVFTNLGDDYTGLVVREPIGVVGAIVPWNFPALVFSQKVPSALAAGCSVVVKPAEITSGTTLELARIASECGIPDGVLNVVTGYGDPVGSALTASPHVDLISFTGSTATGAKILDGQRTNFKRVALELGGKAANIVFADADLDEAVEGSVFGAYLNAGEECVAAARLLVQDSIADAFVEQVVERTRQLVVGDPFDEATDVGALIHPEHRAKVVGYIEAGQRDGAELRCGGEVLDRDGVYLSPAVLDRVQPEASVFREEIFGPVLTVTRFSTIEEAILLANDTIYGLGNSVWSSDITTALRVARALRSGTVWINTTIDGSPQLPFGGYKASGYGREMGVAGVEEFTVAKAVHIRLGARAPFFSIASPSHR